MIPTLNSFLESVSNPIGRFKVLDGVYPVRGADGRVLFTVRRHSVVFPVVCNGRAYKLKCFLSGDEQIRQRARGIAEAIGRQEERAFTGDYRYLEAEMVAISPSGRTCIEDVVVQHVPEGRGMHAFLLGCCDREDSPAVGTLLKGIARMSAWLAQAGIVHRNIKGANIHVAVDGGPVLLNYDYAQAAVGTLGLEADNMALARLGMALYVIACDPAIYRTLRQAMAFLPEGAHHLAEAICEAGPGQPCPELYTLAAALRQGFIARGELDDLLGALCGREMSAAMLPAPVMNLGSEWRTMPDYPGTEDAPPTLAQDVDGLWIYRDAQGGQAYGRRFEYAEDFTAGRALVAVDGTGTLIDSKGRQVLPAPLECQEWDAEQGVASVALYGRCGLYDRDGKALTALCYDWLGSWREGLLLAQKGDKFGFLDATGREAIGFIYDEASSFSGGVAPVRIGGEEFRIDRTGARVK